MNLACSAITGVVGIALLHSGPFAAPGTVLATLFSAPAERVARLKAPTRPQHMRAQHTSMHLVASGLESITALTQRLRHLRSASNASAARISLVSGTRA